MTNKIWRMLAMLFALALVASACGSDDAEEATDDVEAVEEDDAMAEDDDAMAEDDDAMAEDDDAMAEDDDAMAEEEGTVEAAPTCTGESDGVLQIGGILPETGDLAYLGPPEFAATELAVADINEAGGVLGEDVVWSPGDSGDNGDVANATVDRLINDVDAFLGAASSGVSFQVIDKITGACKIHFSPANTSGDFTDYEEDDLYFRTAPTDILQGRVLAELIVDEGSTTVGLMARQDPYGEGLLNFTKGPLEEAGAEVVEDFVYDPKAGNFDAEVGQIVDADPEAIVVIGFDETSQILIGLFEAGFTPDVKKIYLVDGNMSNKLGEKFDEMSEEVSEEDRDEMEFDLSRVLSGIAGTAASAPRDSDFEARLLEVDPDLVDFLYGPETYDAVVIMALAAELAGTDDPAAVAAKINGVTRDGEVCTSFADCKAIIEAGGDPDYDGPSGPQAFSEPGEPTEASYAILRYAEDSNKIDPELTEYRFANL